MKIFHIVEFARIALVGSMAQSLDTSLEGSLSGVADIQAMAHPL
ncbi:hypothetical protein PIIN_11369 [Serendipita indica DSM 11827]|uniref:Uncharacterized protein n=1 Tax=Serendipita indica (strain DSM 11827) TaxID=1109443 RepID=G4U1E9_SERID|nr:hypothetical protein PIIN_11369 [Serendipita indica DSM 11827]